MSKSAKGSAFGLSGLEWGYGGVQFERARRVTVFPYEMLGDLLTLSAEARGILLTIFCRYWSRDAALESDDIRREHGVSSRLFARVLGELTRAGVIDADGGKLAPAKTFGPNLDRPKERRENTRDMPSDWLAKREAVFARDGYACVYCGSGGLELHCDHVVPVARGGGHEIENLVTACAVCNLSKGAKSVAEWRPDLSGAFER